MTTTVRLWIAGVAFTAALCLVYVASPAYALGDKDLQKTVKDIAAAFKKGNAEEATKMAVKSAKGIAEVADLMEMYRPVNKGGLGLENNLKKPTVKNAEELGNLAAAMAELTLAKTPEKDAGGGKTKAAWVEYTKQLREGSLELAKAKDAKAVKTAAEKVNNACAACHSKFKS
jgi:hypothetical protein